jgi:hypothetical protein
MQSRGHSRADPTARLHFDNLTPDVVDSLAIDDAKIEGARM